MQEKLIAATGRLQGLEADRDAWRRKYRNAVRERDRERSALAAVLQSRSYRLGRALAMLVRHPIRSAPKLARAVARLALQHLRPTVPRSASVGQNVQPEPSPVAVVVPERLPSAEKKPRSVLSEVLPVYAYVARGFDLDSLRSLARAIGQSALIKGDHVPLIVTDQVQFALLRDTGLAIEYIPDREAWERHRRDLDWDDFYADRLGHLLRIHQPTRTFFLDQATALPLSFLLALHLEAK
jgi:hypothetical protein